MPTEAGTAVAEVRSPGTGVARSGESAGPDGVLLVDKPSGITSHDVVDALRRVFGTRAIGHTGTLDPAASGLMILLVGKATKIAPFISGMDKCYRAEIRLGQTSDTGDAEGNLTLTADPSSVTHEKITSVLQSLQGEISLKIPAYAAVRSHGKRRYELARAGEDVPALDRVSRIDSAVLLSFANPIVTVRVRCASGTYIRSYAEAIGQALACGAYLAGLRREEIGPWHVDDAKSIATLESARPDDRQTLSLRPIEEFLLFAKVRIADEFVPAITMGQPITRRMIAAIDGRFAAGDTVVACAPSGRAIAALTALSDSTSVVGDSLTAVMFQYRRVLI